MSLFLVVPLVLVFLYGLGQVDRNTYAIILIPPTTQNYARVLALDGLVIPLLLKTFAVAAVQTLFSLVVGYAIAYFIARLAKEKWRGMLMSLIVIPFWVSFVVRIFGLFAFTVDGGAVVVWLRGARLGLVADILSNVLDIGTFHMLILTLTYVWIPFMILPLFANLVKIDPQLLEAASDLGASRMRAFFRVTVPLTIPGIMTGSILTFITSVGSFVEPIMVGGTDWLLVGNFVNDYFNQAAGLPTGAAASMLLIVATLLLITVYTKYAESEISGEVKGFRTWAWLRSLLLTRFTRRPSGPPAPLHAPRTHGMDPRRLRSDGEKTAPDGGVPAAHVTVGGVPRGEVERMFDWLVERLGKPVLAAVTLSMIAWLFLPLIFVAVFSFNAGVDSFGVWEGFSLKWYLGENVGTATETPGLFSDREVMAALTNSIIIGIGSAFIALVFGLMAAYALNRFRLRFATEVKSVMYLGLVIPSIVLGISLAILIRFMNDFLLSPIGFAFTGSPLEWEKGLTSVLVGHATFNIPLATLVLLIGFREFDRSLEEAAYDLGADEITTFMRVTIPNLMPSIVSALLLTFTFSFDELIVTLFLSGQGFTTLPVVIWGLISKRWLTPQVNAASTLILALSIVFVIAANKVQRGGTLFRI